jgi:hypothetical protein
MEQQQFEELLKRLDILIRLNIINTFQDKSRSEVIRILADIGYANQDIASILGTTPAYVANVRSSMKRKKNNPVKTAKKHGKSKRVKPNSQDTSTPASPEQRNNEK